MNIHILKSLKLNQLLMRQLGRANSTSPQYDLAVIGSGPGGYVASIKASQLGLKTVCIEKSKTLGGTCLNVGCIPSKALLNSSHHYHLIKSGKLSSFGIKVDGVSFDLEKMMANKNSCVSMLTGGIAALFKYNKVDHVSGCATIKTPGEIEVALPDGSSKMVAAKNILIATGSDIMPFPGITIDETTIVSSTGALELKSVPKNLTIIGGGVIGLELGSVWNRLGSKVTVIEFLNNIGGANIDSDISKSLQSILKKEGVDFLLGHKVTSARKDGNTVVVTYENMSNNQKDEIKCDVLLVCVGRRPYIEKLGLEKIGVNIDQKGRILVNDHYRTNIQNIYAIGDCIPGPMLAHKAEDEGIACVEGIAGNPAHINYNAIPSVIYTHPEVAWVGITEDEAKRTGIKYKIGKFPLSSNGRSRAVCEIDGFAKVIAEEGSDKLLGAHFISSCAGEVINQMSMAIEYGASAEDVARVCHAHPTVAECLKEACLQAYSGKPINTI